jgi:DNA (cytosine-5)-methyltransferase 1
MTSYVTVTDQFCGAGGSSLGAVAAGAELRLGLNHWKLAIETHNTNFPNADHDCTDLSACDPRRYPATDILITSPECTNHSLAKGKIRRWQQQLDMFGRLDLDPAEERSRATMWDVCRFAEAHHYRIVIVENVVEARNWAPFPAWLHAMELLGYDHQIVYLNSMHAHPTPQSRDRMYVVFSQKALRRPNLDIRPLAHCPRCAQDVAAVQSWKNPARPWGKYGQQYLYRCPSCAGEVTPYYYCAANAIDWSLPAPRIGDRKRALKEKTLKRIQIGLDKFGRRSLLVNFVQNGSDSSRASSIDRPWPTQVGNVHHALVQPPMLVSLNHSDTDRARPITDPAPTAMPQGTPALCVPPYLIDLAYTHGHDDRATGIDDTMPTQTSRQTLALITPCLVDLRGANAPRSPADALSTICGSGNHHGVVYPPFLTSYYQHSTPTELGEAVPTQDTRLTGQQAAVSGLDESLPTVPGRAVHYLAQPGETPAIEECGFRMLQPHEIGAAMAFPSDYVVLGTQRQKVKQYGNAVTPPVMRLLFERVLAVLR